MKLKLTLLFVLISHAFCHAQYTWHSLPAAPKSWRCDDMYFLNPDLGWAINPYYDNITPNQFGRIFKTSDGGNTWQLLKDSSGTYFRSIGFADSLTGWVGNLADTVYYASISERATNDTVPLYQTTNGGTTWIPADLPHPHPQGICGISVVTDSVIYAYGRYMGPAGYVKTVDKGATWVFTDMDSIAIGLVDGHFFNKDTGFITGGGIDNKAQILYTVNGGASWSIVYHSTRPDTERVWKIYFPSRYIGYASIEYEGRDLSYNTWYLSTTDGGLTWVEHPFIANYDEEGIGFINDSVGWIGGDLTLGTYVTYNAGTTWAVDPTFGVATPPYVYSTGFDINRFRTFGDTLMYASGNTIYKLNAGTTSVNTLQTKTNGITTFPNPSHGSFTLNITTPQKEAATITITNILGEKIKQLITATNTNTDIQLDTAPGIYFISATTKNETLTQKIEVW